MSSLMSTLERRDNYTALKFAEMAFQKREERSAAKGRGVGRVPSFALSLFFFFVLTIYIVQFAERSFLIR